MLELIYSLSFLCLLRSDEVLKIKYEDLKLTQDLDTGKFTLTLTLPFRKTSQYGGMSLTLL